MSKGKLTYQMLILRLRLAINNKNDPNAEEITKEEVINDARSLCSDYVEDRLIRSGLNLKHRKITPTSSIGSRTEEYDISCRLNLTVKSERLASLEALQILTERRHSSDGCKLTIDDISKVSMYVGECLELRHTNVYTDVLQQLNVRSLAEVNMRRLFMSVAKELFVEGINWSKIISLFAFAGGLAVDCVLNGSSVHVTRVKHWTVDYIEAELLEWVLAQGGWVSRNM